MGKIYIRTYAYNAEKTLRGAMDSILNQTYGDFVYYVCENGSTDGTRGIVEEYAGGDSRIRPFFNDVNNDHSKTEECLNLPYSLEKGDFFCTLDADDEYMPTFFEKAMALIDENNLDIAACGSRFIDTRTGLVMNGGYSIPRNLILRSGGFKRHFRTYMQFMYTIWGKLFSGALLRRCDFTKTGKVGIGNDTVFSLEAFSQAGKVGILGGTLHKYYISPKSTIHKYDSGRVASNQAVCECMFDFLRVRDAYSPENRDYVYSVYTNIVNITIRILTEADICPAEKLCGFFDILNYKRTKAVLAKPGICGNLAEVINANIKELISKSPITAGLSADAAIFMREVVTHVLKGDMPAALDEILRISEREIPDEHAEAFLRTAQTVAAAVEASDVYVFFSKIRTSHLIDCGRFDEAAALIDEFGKLLPDDPDFAGMRKKISCST